MADLQEHIDGRADHADRHTKPYRLDVSDETFAVSSLAFDDPIVTAAQVAEKFGAHPIAQFKVLHWLPNGEIESKRPNEPTDLRDAGRERFFVIRSDRSFGLTIDGLSLEWPLAAIAGKHLRVLARANDRQDLIRVTPQGFMPIDEDEDVRLDAAEAEEFRLVARKATVTVFYREQPIELERRKWSTEELIEKFGVPAGYKLDLIKSDGEFVELKPGQALKVREGTEFTSHVPVGQSS